MFTCFILLVNDTKKSCQSTRVRSPGGLDGVQVSRKWLNEAYESENTAERQNQFPGISSGIIRIGSRIFTRPWRFKTTFNLTTKTPVNHPNVKPVSKYTFLQSVNQEFTNPNDNWSRTVKDDLEPEVRPNPYLPSVNGYGIRSLCWLRNGCAFSPDLYTQKY